MSYERIRVERDGDVATLTLANPEKRNVLALETMQEITAALREIGETDALGVIIAAEGPVFSAGHNFGDMLGSSEDIGDLPPHSSSTRLRFESAE